VFPQGHVFAIWRAVDLVMVAMPEGNRFALERLESPAARYMLERAGIGSPESIAAYYAGPLGAFRPIAEGAPLNRDDRPIVEYRAPRDLVAVGRTSLEGDPRVTGSVPFAEAPPAGPLFSAWGTERWFATRARSLADRGDSARAVTAARAARANGFEGLAAAVELQVESESRRRNGLALVRQAQELVAAGRHGEARPLLEQAARIDPAYGRTWVMLADQYRLVRDFATADEALARARTDPDSVIQAEAALVAGMVELGRQRPAPAADQFREAQRWNPTVSAGYLLEAQARTQAGDAAGARDAIRRGLQALPGNAELAAALGQLGTGR
jgi:Tfp pilus assembly protein PilF